MEKRYQVFVSSTYEDLREERQEVMHALLEHDCIPAGMELFPAADETQWSFIQKVIDECDYYVLVLAGRYGSCASNGLGYTEQEYRYALSKKKPTIAFLHQNPANITSGNSEQTDEGKRKLAAFRELAQEKLCRYWSSSKELGFVVGRSLNHLIKTRPTTGWVRADELADKDATRELLKLRRRIEELEAELLHARTTPSPGTQSLAQGNDILSIEVTGEARFLELYEDITFSETVRTTWNSLFGSVGPFMMHDVAESKLKAVLDEWFGQKAIPILHRRGKQWKAARWYSSSITHDDFHTILIQLRALELIVQSDGARSSRDPSTYWRLTPYGDSVITRLRAIKRRKT